MQESLGISLQFSLHTLCYFLPCTKKNVTKSFPWLLVFWLYAAPIIACQQILCQREKLNILTTKELRLPVTLFQIYCHKMAMWTKHWPTFAFFISDLINWKQQPKNCCQSMYSWQIWYNCMSADQVAVSVGTISWKVETLWKFVEKQEEEEQKEQRKV